MDPRAVLEGRKISSPPVSIPDLPARSPVAIPTGLPDPRSHDVQKSISKAVFLSIFLSLHLQNGTTLVPPHCRCTRFLLLLIIIIDTFIRQHSPGHRIDQSQNQLPRQKKQHELIHSPGGTRIPEDKRAYTNALDRAVTRTCALFIFKQFLKAILNRFQPIGI